MGARVGLAHGDELEVGQIGGGGECGLWAEVGRGQGGKSYPFSFSISFVLYLYIYIYM